MAIVLKRLQGRLRSSMSDFGDFSLDSADLSDGYLSSRLNAGPVKRKHAVFTVLVEQDAALALEYNTLRALLRETLATSPVDEEKVTLLVHEAIELAEILVEKYSLYINDRGNVRKSSLEEHIGLYRQWLTPCVAHQETPRSWLAWLSASFTWSTKTLANQFTTESMNPRRLYFLRDRRLALALVPLLNDFYHYASWTIWADAFVAPCLTYLAIVFFLPRLASNLYVLFTSDKTKKEEAGLAQSTRFDAQWNRLWPQIANDISWAGTGTLMFFVFIGSMQPLGIFLSVAAQFCDLILASVRAYYELRWLNSLAQEYNTLLLDSSVDYLHAREYVQTLEKSIQRERALLTLSVTNALVLFFAICFALPVLAAIHPLLSAIGAVMAVLMTFINFEGRHYIAPPLSTKDLDTMLKKGRTPVPVPQSIEINPCELELLPVSDVPAVVSMDDSIQEQIESLARPEVECRLNEMITHIESMNALLAGDETSILAEVQLISLPTPALEPVNERCDNPEIERKCPERTVSCLLSTPDFMFNPAAIRRARSCPQLSVSCFTQHPKPRISASLDSKSEKEREDANSPRGITTTLSATQLALANNHRVTCEGIKSERSLRKRHRLEASAMSLTSH